MFHFPIDQILNKTDLWDVNIALWVVFLFIAMKVFRMRKMCYFTFTGWDNFAVGWPFDAVFGN